MRGAHGNCDTCTIRHRGICAALSDAELTKLSQIARRKHFVAGQTILADGEKADFFGNIISGVVKLAKTLADGRQHIFGLLFVSDFLGRAFRESNPYFAEAATDVELCYFPRAGFERLLVEFPDLERRLFQLTLEELDACRDFTLLLGRKTAEERVANFLFNIARRAPNLGCHHSPALDFVQFDLPLTRADMADYLGLTIETVSRQITKLKTKNIIEAPNYRDIIVPSLDRLAYVAGVA